METAFLIAGISSAAPEEGVAGPSGTRDHCQWKNIAEMAAPVTNPALSAVCIGEADAFASEMIKMINDKEFRFGEYVLYHL